MITLNPAVVTAVVPRAAAGAAVFAAANPVAATVLTGAVIGLAGWKYGELAYEQWKGVPHQMGRFFRHTRRSIHNWTREEPRRTRGSTYEIIPPHQPPAASAATAA